MADRGVETALPGAQGRGCGALHLGERRPGREVVRDEGGGGRAPPGEPEERPEVPRCRESREVQPGTAGLERLVERRGPVHGLDITQAALEGRNASKAR